MKFAFLIVLVRQDFTQKYIKLLICESLRNVNQSRVYDVLKQLVGVLVEPGVVYQNFAPKERFAGRLVYHKKLVLDLFNQLPY